MKKPRTKHGATRDAVLNIIRTYTLKHGFAPSIREISDELGLKSVSNVYHHITKLVEEGRIKYTYGVSRSYIIVDDVTEPDNVKILEMYEGKPTAIEWCGHKYILENNTRGLL